MNSSLGPVYTNRRFLCI